MISPAVRFALVNACARALWITSPDIKARGRARSITTSTASPSRHSSGRGPTDSVLVSEEEIRCIRSSRSMRSMLACSSASSWTIAMAWRRCRLLSRAAIVSGDLADEACRLSMLFITCRLFLTRWLISWSIASRSSIIESRRSSDPFMAAQSAESSSFPATVIRCLRFFVAARRSRSFPIERMRPSSVPSSSSTMRVPVTVMMARIIMDSARNRFVP